MKQSSYNPIQSKKWRDSHKEQRKTYGKVYHQKRIDDPVRKATFSEKWRESYLKRVYNISLEQHQEMWEKQNHNCACCNDPIPSYGKGCNIDHDHTTGEVRALLCTHCNSAFGFVLEDEQRILYLLEYCRGVKNATRKR